MTFAANGSTILDINSPSEEALTKLDYYVSFLDQASAKIEELQRKMEEINQKEKKEEDDKAELNMINVSIKAGCALIASDILSAIETAVAPLETQDDIAIKRDQSKKSIKIRTTSF